jgi:hypothetical protein
MRIVSIQFCIMISACYQIGITLVLLSTGMTYNAGIG